MQHHHHVRKHRARSIIWKIIKFFLAIFAAVILFVIGLIISFMLSFRDLLVFLPHAGEITGFNDKEKTYLVILQNNNELRPTGGFITSFAIVKFDKGLYKGTEVKDVYSEENNSNYMLPPYPMVELMGIPGKFFSYNFRDANYYPQLPLSAKNLEKIYKINHPDANFDGMMTVNFSVFEDLLGVIGGVKVDDLMLDKNNLFETIEQEVNDVDRHDIMALAGRKNILADFTKELEKKIFSKPDLWPKIGKMIVEDLNNKSIQLYFKDDELQKLAVEKNWAGTWKSPVGDFFAINEANYGGLKSDRYMKKEITYEVRLTPNPKAQNFAINSKLDVNIYHYGIEAIPLSGDYSGYFRAYVPNGAKLIANSGGEDFRTENQKFYYLFSNIVKIKPAEEETLSYQYKLPSSLVKDNKYYLYVPKQSGADNDIYTIIVRLPQGYSLKSDQFETKENIAFFNGKLTNDLEFELEIVPDKNSPYVVFQNIDMLEVDGRMGQLTVSFNEEIAADTAKNLANLKLMDKNEVNKKSDKIKIVGTSVDGRDLKIFFTGMTYQPEERYTLEMTDLKDSSGNFTSPRVKIITLVQRLKAEVSAEVPAKSN